MCRVCLVYEVLVCIMGLDTLRVQWMVYVASLAEFGGLSTILAGRDWPSGAQAWLLSLLLSLLILDASRRAMRSAQHP